MVKNNEQTALPEWAITKACKRSSYSAKTTVKEFDDAAVIAIYELARMIAKHEQPPVGDDVLIVRAVIAGFLIAYRGASMDDCGDFTTALCAYRAKKAELDEKA
jgi:hypothetical protein